MEETDICFVAYYGGLFHCKCGGDCYRISLPCTVFKGNLPGIWGSLLSALVIVLFISPFLRAIMIKKNHSVEFVTLWRDSRGNRAPLVATIVLRILLAVSFVMFVIAGLFKLSVGLVFGVAVLLVIVMILSRQLKRQSIMIERTFFRICGRGICVRNIWARRSLNMQAVCFRVICI